MSSSKLKDSSVPKIKPRNAGHTPPPTKSRAVGKNASAEEDYEEDYDEEDYDFETFEDTSTQKKGVQQSDDDKKKKAIEIAKNNSNDNKDYDFEEDYEISFDQGDEKSNDVVNEKSKSNSKVHDDIPPSQPMNTKKGPEDDDIDDNKYDDFEEYEEDQYQNESFESPNKSHMIETVAQSSPTVSSAGNNRIYIIIVCV